MKAIVNTAPNRLELQEIPLPQPGKMQVRIRTGACGICATDLQMIAGWKRTPFPSIPGHEWAGTVDAAGEGVDHALVRQRCVAENVLSDGGEVGFEYPGGYAEYFLTEAAKVHLLPVDFPMATAAIIEPLAVCVRGMKRLRLENQQRFLIIGDGPIGLLTLILLHHAGIRDIMLLGGREKRLALARELGAVDTINYHLIGADLVEGVLKQAGQAFSIVIETSGSGTAMQASLYLTEDCGKILQLGDYGPARADFEWNYPFHHQLEIIGSNASAGAWEEAVRLAVVRRLPLEKLLTHRLPAARFAEGIELTRSKQVDLVKVVLEWEGQDD
ncbi:MAG: zinc-dependent alcohol dehydrogenase [Omnitrophica WOR_2 bacterium]